MELLDQIKGLSRHVMHCMGKGHRESIYQEALVVALNRANITHRAQVVCPIYFMGQVVGYGKADLVIDDVVIEIKSNKQPPMEASSQLCKYIESISKSERRPFSGLVINFNAATGRIDLLVKEKPPVTSPFFPPHKRPRIHRIPIVGTRRLHRQNHGSSSTSR